MLGVCPNGTVTVDWGDGTTPDTLTGTSTSTVKWTPNHEYAAPGDYVIKLTVDGEIGMSGINKSNQYSYILRHSSSSDERNYAYYQSLKRVELGGSVTSIGNYFLNYCYSLDSITIPNGVTSIGDYSFNCCYSLKSVVFPSGVKSVGQYAFAYAHKLKTVSFPSSVTSIGKNFFYNCYLLDSITIPNGVTSIVNYFLYNCYSLDSITIPNGVTSIVNNFCPNGYSLKSVVFPSSVTSIEYSAFNCSYSACYFDFTKHAAVPTLGSFNAFNMIPDDCEIRVPAALYDEWIAATNWATYASKIVAV